MMKGHGKAIVTFSTSSEAKSFVNKYHRYSNLSTYINFEVQNHPTTNPTRNELLISPYHWRLL